MDQRSINQLINEVNQHRHQLGLRPLSTEDWLRFSVLLEQRTSAVTESVAEPECYQITEDDWNAECDLEDESRVPIEAKTFKYDFGIELDD